MEFVRGRSLRELLVMRGGSLPEAEAVHLAAQVAAGLQYAHEQGVVHCDLKPENIIITDEGVAKTVDFGIAELFDHTLSTREARGLIGTIPYLAPEVIGGAKPNARSDIYSLALTLYEMVAGRLPFAGGSAAVVAGQRLAVAAPALRTFAASASPALEATLSHALALNPADRYRTAAEFGNALHESAAAAQPVATRAVPTTRILTGADHGRAALLGRRERQAVPRAIRRKARAGVASATRPVYTQWGI